MLLLLRLLPDSVQDNWREGGYFTQQTMAAHFVFQLI